MSTEHLFSVQASSSCQSLLLRDPLTCQGLFGRMHRTPLFQHWSPLEFAFQVAGKKGLTLPDICTVYARGVMVMRADVRDALFPDAAAHDGWEFLPVVVEQQRWWMLNCLSTVTEIDEEASEVVRAMNGDVARMQKLTVTDPKARQLELFTLARSSCTQLFARPAFKSRVEKLRLKGIHFQHIGKLMTQAA